MKMRTIKLTAKQFTEALQGKTSALSNLPGDLEVLDIKFDLSANKVTAVVRSESFEDIPETYPLPELTLTYTAKPLQAPQPAPAIKAEPKSSIAVSKPEPSKKPEVAPSQQASRIANEFSPDQRKLLSFKVEGEFVIVKPVQFLKEEWEDINEVVRSCGGRWVKGDIISYWEIPAQ
jgi:hypothetical protein